MKPSSNTTLDRLQFRRALESYGVTVTIGSNDAALLEQLIGAVDRAVAGQTKVVDGEAEISGTFGIAVTEKNNYELFANGDSYSSGSDRELCIEDVEGRIRIFVAEHAVDRVFVHAGVVSFGGWAFIFPGESQAGKSSLVTALIRRGADYLSDEYAVLDSNGLCHPFARDLLLREGIDGRSSRSAVDPNSLGATVVKGPLPVGAVVLTQYDSDAVWSPETISVGTGILEIVPHCISINSRPAFSLNVLNSTLSRAIILKGTRGEAHVVADWIANFAGRTDFSEPTLESHVIP